MMERTFTQTESILPMTAETVALAGAYSENKVAPAAYADHARHVAIAVVHRVTVVVSWNFPASRKSTK